MSATHTAPSPAAIPAPTRPTGVVATIELVAGSMRETVWSLAFVTRTRACPDGDAGRSPTDADGVCRVCRGIDSRDRVRPVVGDPHGSVVRRDRRRGVPDPDLLRDVSGSVDPHHLVASRLGDPHRAAAEGRVGRRTADVDLGRDVVGLGVEAATAAKLVGAGGPGARRRPSRALAARSGPETCPPACRPSVEMRNARPAKSSAVAPTPNARPRSKASVPEGDDVPAGDDDDETVARRGCAEVGDVPDRHVGELLAVRRTVPRAAARR